MADNKFLKVMKDAATDRGLMLYVGRGGNPKWANISSGGNDRVTIEVDFSDDGQGSEFWTAEVYEWRGDESDLAHKDFGNDTASLFRLLGTWLG